MSSFVLTKYAQYGGPAVMGYPKGARIDGLTDGGWLQPFANGAILDSNSTSTTCIYGYRWTMWQANGRETGPLKYPVALVENFSGGGWIQRFQRGCIVVGPVTPRAVVHNAVWTAWVELGREGGELGFPLGDRQQLTRGSVQRFEGGGLWALTDQPAFAVRGAVLTQWEAEGGVDGSYGYPTAHVVDNGDGTLTGTFEGGTITV
jgi:uncharacterized protein with LGFP repeats